MIERFYRFVFVLEGASRAVIFPQEGSELNINTPLAGQVALVAGATRGAGRGIACMLGEAGAIVYCSGRSTREHRPTDGVFAGRPETIDETAEMVTRHGGEDTHRVGNRTRFVGSWVRGFVGSLVRKFVGS
jgi:NAD(P)-dependent dehydrogenase (short-subunit alcohol dehydrogenase family)